MNPPPMPNMKCKLEQHIFSPLAILSNLWLVLQLLTLAELHSEAELEKAGHILHEHPVLSRLMSLGRRLATLHRSHASVLG